MLIAESRREMERKLEDWRYPLKSRGVTKTKYFTTDAHGEPSTSKYLGSMVDEKSDVEKEVNLRIQCG